MEQQQQDHQSPLHVGHHNRRGRKLGHHHLRVPGHGGGHCGGGRHVRVRVHVHGHKHHGKHENGHRHGHRRGHGHGQGFVVKQEQAKHGGRLMIVVARANGAEHPHPEGFEGEIIHRHHHRHHGHHRGHGHCHGNHHLHHCHRGQATETDAPNNELPGAVVRMSLEGEP